MARPRPIIGIPLGDPAGVGPEIAVRAVADGGIAELARPVLIGSRSVVEGALAQTGISREIVVIDDPRREVVAPQLIGLIAVDNIEAPDVRMGEVQAGCGRAAHDWITEATRRALDGQLDAIATTPVSKVALAAAGIDEIGHTEILAALTGTEDPLTMFQVRDLRIFFLTRHLSLRDAIAAITRERLLDYLERCCAALERLGMPRGPLAVAGLNPHGSDDGRFGDEESRVIAPAVETAVGRGLPVQGPIPADSVFHLALTGRYVAVLSLFHDQGHIAAKTYDFSRTISLTLGMPFLRTSVDHGTAFDIAGRGQADATSMIEAIGTAAVHALAYRR